MRDFLTDLRRADSFDAVLKTVMENKGQAVKLALAAVALITVCFIYTMGSTTELRISDEADAGVTDDVSGSQEEGDGTSGNGTEASEYGAGNDPANTGAAATDTDGMVYVDIGGAVKQPMLAELPSGSRVEDAIEAAGGLTGKADLTTINRAQILTDGEKIYIPKKGDTSAGASGTGGSGSGASGSGSSGSSGASSSGTSGTVGLTNGKININTADITLLQQITGVGPVTAQKIVDYREANGNFSAIEDLKNVSGIGDKTFANMEDEITI